MNGYWIGSAILISSPLVFALAASYIKRLLPKLLALRLIGTAVFLYLAFLGSDMVVEVLTMGPPVDWFYVAVFVSFSIVLTVLLVMFDRKSHKSHELIPWELIIAVYIVIVFLVILSQLISHWAMDLSVGGVVFTILFTSLIAFMGAFSTGSLSKKYVYERYKPFWLEVSSYYVLLSHLVITAGLGHSVAASAGKVWQAVFWIVGAAFAFWFNGVADEQGNPYAKMKHDWGPS